MSRSLVTAQRVLQAARLRLAACGNVDGLRCKSAEAAAYEDEDTGPVNSIDGKVSPVVMP